MPDVHGGSGEQFDWQIITSYKGLTPFFLSGGISPEDVNALLELKHARFAGIDLNGKANYLALIEKTSLAQVQQLYKSMVLGKDNEQYLIQVRGSQFEKAPLATLPGAKAVSDLRIWQQQAKGQ